jgi:MULE transposase-like protein/MuDR family transposase
VSKIGVDYEHSLFFMNPNCLQLQEGLKRVNSDESVMEMAKLGVKFRVVSIYILKVGDDVELEGKLTCRVPKLSVKRPSRSKLGYKKQSNSSGPLPCEESDSIISQDPIPLSTFIPTLNIQCPPPNPTQALKGQVGDSEVCDGEGSEQFEDALSEGLDEQVVSGSSDSDSDDESYCVSDEGTYVANEHTDWKKFKWRVGGSFPNPNAFKDAVTQYALAQGRNIKFAVSNKKRQNRLGVVCVSGCPFRLYASWDKKLAEYTVKSVTNTHTCQRNMEVNSRLRSKWVAVQMLEVFKKRPHISSNEIIDMIKSNYSVICRRDFAYHVKYAAHKMLHGSMKDHYNKVMNYFEALKISCPQSKFTVVTVPNTNPPIFQRFFVFYEALGNGWYNGCKKVLCIDGCFIKTFLGGMLLSAIGRDPNEQMFPVAWAVVEGENNESWEWFLSEFKKGLPPTNGEGWTIISDEHQVLNYSF